MYMPKKINKKRIFIVIFLKKRTKKNTPKLWSVNSLKLNIKKSADS